MCGRDGQHLLAVKDREHVETLRQMEFLAGVTTVVLTGPGAPEPAKCASQGATSAIGMQVHVEASAAALLQEWGW